MDVSGWGHKNSNGEHTVARRLVFRAPSKPFLIFLSFFTTGFDIKKCEVFSLMRRFRGFFYFFRPNSLGGRLVVGLNPGRKEKKKRTPPSL